MTPPTPDPPPNDAPACVQLIISGRVQGVGFRFFALNAARRRQVTGWTRNRPDGSVEVVARGPRGALEALIGELRQGPRFSRVDEIETDWTCDVPESPDFVIRR